MNTEPSFIQKIPQSKVKVKIEPSLIDIRKNSKLPETYHLKLGDIHYKEGPIILNHVDVTIGTKIPILLLGTNGGGKSTFLKYFLKDFLAPASIPVYELKPELEHPLLGENLVYYFASDNRFLELPFTFKEIFDSLEAPFLLSPLHNASRFFEFKTLRSQFPNFDLTKKLNELSQGNQQIGFLLLGLVFNDIFNIYILDEPFGNISKDNVRKLLNIFAEKLKDKYLIISSNVESDFAFQLGYDIFIIFSNTKEIFSIKSDALRNTPLRFPLTLLPGTTVFDFPTVLNHCLQNLPFAYEIKQQTEEKVLLDVWVSYFNSTALLQYIQKTGIPFLAPFSRTNFLSYLCAQGFKVFEPISSNQIGHTK
jgi:ABC-type Mn2+/Zn2+ transport system ATPase subunit